MVDVLIQESSHRKVPKIATDIMCAN
jgi:hypothetical protein